MPHPFSFARHVDGEAIKAQEMEAKPPPKRPRRAPWSTCNGGLAMNHEPQEKLCEGTFETGHIEHGRRQFDQQARRTSLPDPETWTRDVPSIPQTLHSPPQPLDRHESERRERLLQHRPDTAERRQLHAERKRNRSASPRRGERSPQPALNPSASAPEISTPGQHLPYSTLNRVACQTPERQGRGFPVDLPPLRIPEVPFYNEFETEEGAIENDRTLLEDEYDRRWILNLSMHFRDNSNREKFFVTYAETPSRWRRLTVSLDYRNPVEGSLEADLSTLHFQRDKSFRIYEAIRESLPDIQYYDTVTNLKLETTADDGQLHVHVREDANEIVQYPSTSLFEHVQHVPLYREDRLDFLSHLSGFVYRVHVDGRTLIKKEIPGPDTVDEFLYEVNALDALLGCANVVQLQGLVTDNEGSVVKGLLISYAPQGALVDMIYDFRGELPWYRREKWAKQIVQGLSDVHEAGFVQGDFTISNIVVDADDDAQIIDINRRGCPVGWEPPELGKLIDSGQRIGMHIGVKTDLYQLGMVLWALAEENDEPERAERPLSMGEDVPSYYRRMVETCLSKRPQDRLPANKLLRAFPLSAGKAPSVGSRSVDFLVDPLQVSDNSISTAHRSDKEYIDPSMAVTIDEVRRRRRASGATDFTSGQVTYVDPDSNAASTDYNFETSGSWDLIHRRRGRSPVSSRRRPSSPYGRSISSATSISSAESAGRRLQRRAIYDDESDICGEDEELHEGAAAFDRSPLMEPEDPTLSVKTAMSANSRREGESTKGMPPALPGDPRLAAVQAQEFAHIASLPHTDSGFDEQMIEEIESLNHGTPAANKTRTHSTEEEDAAELLPRQIAWLGLCEASAADSITLVRPVSEANGHEKHEIRQE